MQKVCSKHDKELTLLSHLRRRDLLETRGGVRSLRLECGPFILEDWWSIQVVAVTFGFPFEFLVILQEPNQVLLESDI